MHLPFRKSPNRPVISNPSFVPSSRSESKADVSTTTCTEIKDDIAAPPATSPFNNRWWWEELAAATLSVACVVAVVALLWVFDGRSLASWPLPISLNALLAVFTTIAKTALLVVVASCISQLKWLHFEKPRSLDDLTVFDDASRGPWGSLVLMYRINVHAVLGSIAALVTIASLGLDPSVQQILDYPLRSLSHATDLAAVGLATCYDIAQVTVNGISATDGQGSRAPDSSQTTKAKLAIQGSILGGLYGTTQPLPFDCPSSTCSWPDFTTFAMCGSCSDVTSEVATAREDYTCYLPFVQTSWACGVNSGLNGTLVNYTLPEHFSINGQPEVLQQVLAEPPDSCQLHCDLPAVDPVVSMLNISTTYVWDFDAPYLDNIRDMTNFFLLRGIEVRGDSSVRSHHKVSDCTLQWCAQTYKNVTSTNGKLHSASTVEVPLKRLNLSATDPVIRNMTKDVPYRDSPFVDFQVWAPDPAHASNMAPGFADARYLINSISSSNLAGYLVDLLNRDLFWNDAMMTPDTEPASRPGYLTGISQALYQDGLDTSIKSIADAVTQTMRTGMNSTLHFGQSHSRETYIRVRWGWLAPTIIVVILNNAIFGISMVRTAQHQRRHRSLLWKYSPLSYLFHGLEGWHGEDLEVHNLRQMEEKGKGMRARLARNDTGEWRFINTMS